MPTDVSVQRRVEIATRLLSHLRAQGRANLAQLETIQAMLAAEEINRPLLRILDAIVWFSHPAAGVRHAKREIAVRVA